MTEPFNALQLTTGQHDLVSKVRIEHFERDVDADGTVHEKTIVEVKDPILNSGQSQSKSKKNKGKEKVKETYQEGDPDAEILSLAIDSTNGMAVAKPAARRSSPTAVDIPVAPASPAPSNHSRRPDIIVNVNVAPPPADSTPSRPPASNAPPSSLAVGPPGPSTVHPSTVPLPPSVASSPAPSLTSMRLPKFMIPPHARTVETVVEDEEEAVEEPVNPTVPLVTQTVTTTTTTNPPAVPLNTGVGWVENDPAWKPQKKMETETPVPANTASEVLPGRVVETKTVERVTYPPGTSPPNVDGSGTKAGLRPIPIVDYQKLIKTTPKKKKLPLPALTQLTNLIPQPPRTVASLSAEVDRDGLGNEQLQARLRDHTGAPQAIPAANVAFDLGAMPKKDRKRREPIYKRLGDALGPPKSERYAYPPATTQIEQGSRQRWQNRFGAGPGPGFGPNGNALWTGFPPPAPPMFPAPPAMMGSVPPMMGPPLTSLNPALAMSGVGMGGLGGVGGMGMLGPPMSGMGMPYDPPVYPHLPAFGHTMGMGGMNGFGLGGVPGMGIGMGIGYGPGAGVGAASGGVPGGGREYSGYRYYG